MPRGPSSTRPARGWRRLGYLVAVGFHVALLAAVHVSPGWKAVPLLTEDTAKVIGVVTASIVVGLVLNLVYVATDPPWLRRLGDAITAAMSCAVAVVVLRVFPFALSGRTAAWESGLRWGLIAVAVVSGIGAVVNLVAVVAPDGSARLSAAADDAADDTPNDAPNHASHDPGSGTVAQRPGL